MVRYNDTDFLHVAARVAYLENELITRDELLKAVDAESVKEAYRTLASKQIFKNHDIEEYELAFEESLAETYALVEEITGNMGLTNVFRYPIDGHNMKVMIKSQMAKGDFGNLYKTGGTVGIETLKREFENKDFYYVPEILAESALKASDQLAKTRDSQIVDILIDKAVLELVSKESDNIYCDCMIKYITVKIDLINAKSALRLLRMKKDVYTASKFLLKTEVFQ